MTLVKLTGHGQVTIPKEIRERLGLHEGDYFEAEIVGDRVVMTPQKSGKEASVKRLRTVMDRVHAKNPDADEDEVVAIALEAVEEIRHEKRTKKS